MKLEAFCTATFAAVHPAAPVHIANERATCTIIDPSGTRVRYGLWLSPTTRQHRRVARLFSHPVQVSAYIELAYLQFAARHGLATYQVTVTRPLNGRGRSWHPIREDSTVELLRRQFTVGQVWARQHLEPSPNLLRDVAARQLVEEWLRDNDGAVQLHR